MRGEPDRAITCVYIILCVISVCYSIVTIATNDSNKVILMEPGETPSLGPSRCFARLILSFAEMRFMKCVFVLGFYNAIY